MTLLPFDENVVAQLLRVLLPARLPLGWRTIANPPALPRAVVAAQTYEWPDTGLRVTVSIDDELPTALWYHVFIDGADEQVLSAGNVITLHALFFRIPVGVELRVDDEKRVHLLQKLGHAAQQAL